MPVIERIYVIGNENAGSFKTLKRLLRRSPKQVAKRIETVGAKYGIEVKVALTHSLEEANAAVAEAVKDKYDAIVSIGGDGTLLAAEKQSHKLHSEIPLLAYPGGSKDYVGRAAGVPRRVKKLFRALNNYEAQVRKIRSGRFTTNNEKGLFNLASGIGSNATLFKNRHFGVGGLVGYAPNVPGIFKDAKFIKAASATVNGKPISLDGVSDVIIHKALSVGGLNFGNKPLDDDSLTLIKVKKSNTPRRSILKLLGVGLWDTLRGGRKSSKEERIEGLKEIKIKLDNDNDMQADGDYSGTVKEVTYDMNDKDTNIVTFGNDEKHWFRRMGKPLTLKRIIPRQQLALAV